MSYKQAILSRISRRSFVWKLPSIDQVKILRDMIEDINEKENTNIQLFIDESAGFEGIKSSYGLFKDVRNYIALVGSSNDENIHEKLGYYGEKLVLTCEMLGLGSCWVGGTFDKEKCKCNVGEDEVFVCAIVFGNTKTKATTKEKIVRSAFHKVKKTKPITELFYSEEEPPNWFIEGMRMVQKAPSALNKMPTRFYYSGGNVSAKIKNPTTMQLYDLGIAKFHFEVGADGGSWKFGNGGLFIRDELQ